MLTQKHKLLISLPNHYPKKPLSILDSRWERFHYIKRKRHDLRGRHDDRGSLKKKSGNPKQVNRLSFVIVVKGGVSFLSFKQYGLRILSERITHTTIITRDKRHKEFSSGKP